MRKIDVATLNERVMYDPESGNITYKASGKVAKSKDKDGYIRVSIGNGVRVLGHRVAWALHHNEDPGNAQLDHINRVKDDNRIQNLRVATTAQNAANRSCKGIRKRYGKWVAQSKHKGKHIHIGVYDCPLIAHMAYRKCMREIHGEYAS
jgi:hypothetical protein